MSGIKYIEPIQEEALFEDVCQIIDGARVRIATYVNTEACLINWYVGKRIKEDVLFNRRAEYGKQVVLNLSVKLTERYGSGWSEKTLRHYLRSAETFLEEDILSATQRQLTWTHLKSLIISKTLLSVSFIHKCVALSIHCRRNYERRLPLPESIMPKKKARRNSYATIRYIQGQRREMARRDYEIFDHKNNC